MRAASSVILFVSACGACLLLVACSTVSAQKQVAYRFAELKEAGKLPGFAAHDHGNMYAEDYPKGGGATYPASMVVCATKEQDPARYAYTFTKESASSEWRLTAAARTMPDGRREDLKVE